MALTLVTSDLIHGLDYSKLTGTIPTWNQDTTGNAATATLAAGATILATARNIGGVSFNGSAAIDLPGVNAAGNQNTSGNAGTVTNGVYTVGNQTIGGVKTFSDVLTAQSLRTSTSNTGYNLISREGSGGVVLYVQGDTGGSLLDVRFGSTTAGGGTRAFQISGTGHSYFGGNVGIGIAPSANSLHIYKSDPTLLIQSSNTSGDAELQFFPRDGSNVAHLQSIKGEGSSLVFSTGGNSGNSYVPTPKLTISSGGNVKIGDSTTDITSKLTVSGNGSVNTATFMYDGNAGTYFDIDTEAANGSVILSADARSGNYPPMLFKTGGSTRLTITSGGNVGIGTTPSGYLTNGYVLRLNGGAQTYMAFNNNTHTTQVLGGMVIGNDANSAWIVQRENQPLTFSTNNANRLIISSEGQATFGSTTDYKIGLNDSAGTNQWWLKSYTNGSFAIHENNVGDKFNILAGGNVGIGTTAPQHKLNVQVGTDSRLGVFGNGTYVGIGAVVDNNSAYRAMKLYATDYEFKIGTSTKLTISSGGLATFQLSALTNPSGVDANTGVIVKNNGWSGITLLSSAATGSFLTFGDADAGFRGRIQYLHGSTDAMVFETAAAERMRITSGGSVHFKFAGGTQGDYNIIGSVAPQNNGNRYAHVRISTQGGDMYYLEVFGYNYGQGLTQGRAGGYVYGGGNTIHSGVVTGNIVTQYENSGYVEIVVDMINGGTGNRWGSFVVTGGTDNITAYQPLTVMAYSFTSSTSRVY